MCGVNLFTYSPTHLCTYAPSYRYDHDTFSKDDLLGRTGVLLMDLIGDANIYKKWLPLELPPSGIQVKNKQRAAAKARSAATALLAPQVRAGPIILYPLHTL